MAVLLREARTIGVILAVCAAATKRCQRAIVRSPYTASGSAIRFWDKIFKKIHRAAKPSQVSRRSSRGARVTGFAFASRCRLEYPPSPCGNRFLSITGIFGSCP
jgi:hypothetical protein